MMSYSLISSLQDTNEWNYPYLDMNLRSKYKPLPYLLGELTHPTKILINKKWLAKQKSIQNFNIDAQGFRKTKLKILPRGK